MKPQNEPATKERERPAEALLKTDLTFELAKLLKSYGCSSTNDGWRRLAIQLAIESGKLPAAAAALEYNPHHDDALPLNGLALIADAVARPGMSKAGIARAAHSAAEAMGINRYSSPESLRAVLGKREGAVQIALDRSRRRGGLPPHLVAKQQLNAVELSSLFPSREEGQRRLNSWWEDRLNAAAKAMTNCRAGQYEIATAVSVSADVKLTSIAIVDDAFDHPEGPPRHGAASAPVRAVFETSAVFSIPGVDGPILHRRVESAVLPPSSCKLQGDAWAWVGKLEDGTDIEIRGTIGAGAVPDVLDGELVVRPPQNRSWRQPIRCTRRSEDHASDL